MADSEKVENISNDNSDGVVVKAEVSSQVS